MSGESAFDNSGVADLHVPGISAPADSIISRYPDRDGATRRFEHGYNEFRSKRLTARELAMLRLMNAITEKPNWQDKIKDETIAAKWHDEAVALPLISEQTWQWCLDELREKADQSKTTGRTPAYDSACRCVKSDVLVSPELRAELVANVAPLLAIPDDLKDWHPGSDGQVLNLVHPSLFPLIYGKTRVLSRGGKVELDDLFAKIGQAQVASRPLMEYETPSDFWSKHFQWLPCEVEFVGDTGTEVRISSYINNLHPSKHRALYGTIEKVISQAIPMWNDVLVIYDNYRKPRVPLRIVTNHAEVTSDMPEDWTDYNSIPCSLDDERLPEYLSKFQEYMERPEGSDEEDEESDDDEDEEEEDEVELGEDEPPLRDRIMAKLRRVAARGSGLEEQHEFRSIMLYPIEKKSKRIRQVQHPEPGRQPTYEDWKSNLEKNSFEISLQDTFRAKGLQVIVKLASIELSPEKPSYTGGSWHLEGMLNEHIVATAIYYYDVDNVTPARIAFRQEASIEEMSLQYEQDDHDPLCEIFGTDSMRDEPGVQELGEIATPQGRLLAFPNTFQHQVGSFELQDKTRPGHRRFLVLWLVDPYYRVCSTRNVPPQQHEWWAEQSIDKIDLRPLPLEVVDMVKSEVGEWPMGMEEAKTHRLKLMKERTRMSSIVVRNFETYNLCEH
jgi:hypothetical protein